MSVTTVPFESVSAPTTAPPAFEPAESGSRTRLLALGGLAAVVLVALLAYFLLFAGDSADPAPVPSPAKAVAPAAPEDSVAQVPASGGKVSAKSFGRDPFKALIVADEAPVGESTTGSTTTGSTTTGSATTGSATTGSTTTGSTTPVGGTTTGTGTVTPVVTADHTFRVVGVSSDQSRITVRVDGKSYSGLKAGDVFATYFKVVVIGGKVNGFQFGDEKFSVFGTKKLHIAA
jgi:hypothetical protein